MKRGSTLYGNWAIIGPIYLRWLDYDGEFGNVLWSLRIGRFYVEWAMSRKRDEALRRVIDAGNRLSQEHFDRTGDLIFVTRAQARDSL